MKRTTATAIGAEATQALGARFAEAISASSAANAVPLLVTLTGELGAGKTTFVGGLLRALGHAGPVRSPTYTLIEPYRLAGRDLQHCDLYRLRHPDELEDLGLRELRRPGAILLIEWPEKAGGQLGTADVAVEMRYDGAESRQVEFSAGTTVGEEIVNRL